MPIDRKDMERILKENVLPVLKKNKFKGTFPDLYRENDGFVDLINFQFYSSGGSFCVNISYADPNRENIMVYKDTEPKKLRVSQTRQRLRLGAENEGSDYWFCFGPTSYGDIRGELKPANVIVDELSKFIEFTAIPWLSEKRLKSVS